MDRLFFRDADAAAVPTAPSSFSTQMLRAAHAPHQQVTQKQKGKTLKWSQEETSRRAICSRNKLKLAQVPTVLACPERDEVAADGSSTKNDAPRHVAPSSCDSITDISDDAASEFSSPYSPKTSLSRSPCDDVEMRRAACSAAHDAPWSPVSARDSANALTNSGLLSPVLQFSRLSLLDMQPLCSTLDDTADLHCAATRASDGSQVQIVPETPTECVGVRDLDTNSCCDVHDVEEIHDCQERCSLELRKATDSCAVIVETPLKQLCHPSTQSTLAGCISPQCTKQHNPIVSASADDEQEIIHAWLQAQTQNLQQAFPSAAKFELLAECCVDAVPLTGENCATENKESHEHAVGMAAAACGANVKPDLRQQQLGSTMLFFPTLQSALLFYSSHSQQASLHLWAEEFSPTGARKFLVAPCDAFARRALPVPTACPSDHAALQLMLRYRYSAGPRFSGGRRHFYEVIPEARPCNLYVDVEWTKKGGANAWIDDAGAMRALAHRLCNFMSSVFAGVQCNPDHILHLDSSTPDKFSRHLILNAECSMRGCEPAMRALFADNLHAGAFMADFVANEAAAAGLSMGQSIDPLMLSQLHQQTEAARLFCFNADGVLTFCVDTGIYNKNRCFRLPLSSKCGKSAVLSPHSSNQMILDGSDICLLKSALVCPCDDILNGSPVRLLTHLKALRLEEVRSGTVEQSARLSQSQRSFKATTRAMASHDCEGSGKSIDGRILDDWATTTGLSGQCCGVKASLVSGGCLVSYALTKANRWCERVGRQHRSNCTFLVADLCAGVYWQSCWDVDCKGFKSRERAIPGWNAAAESMKVQGNYGYDACEHRYTDALPPRVEEQQELWANRSDFIDAAMHEELIWMEAAAACDACTEVEVCKAQTAHCNSRCTSADDVLCAVSSDVDDWYTCVIEAEISKLEQQQQALAEAQCSFEAALLQWRPVVSAHSE